MNELVLEGVVVRRLDDELRIAASWDNCTLIARPHAKACSLQLKFGKRVSSSVTRGTSMVFLIVWLASRDIKSPVI